MELTSFLKLTNSIKYKIKEVFVFVEKSVAKIKMNLRAISDSEYLGLLSYFDENGILWGSCMKRPC